MRIIAALILFAATARGAEVPSTSDVTLNTQPEAIAVFKKNGDVDVKMEPTKAAREFWKLVREQAQKCKCTCPGDSK